METKTKTISGISGALLIILSSLGYVDMTTPDFHDIIPENHTHYCDYYSPPRTYECHSFSKYYKLPNGKCVNDFMTDKLCRLGWKPIYELQNPGCDSVFCEQEGCECV